MPRGKACCGSKGHNICRATVAWSTWPNQGADTFEFLEHEYHSGRTFVVRVCKTRLVQGGHDGQGPKQYLSDYVHGLTELGRFTMDVQSQRNDDGTIRAARKQAEFVVRGAAVLVHPPHAKAGEHGDEPLPLYAVLVTEVQPPAGEKPVEWLLLTNEKVTTFRDAWRVTGWYECRWIVELFHADYEEKDNLYRGGRWAYSSRACVVEAGPLVPAAQAQRSRRRFMRSAKEGVIPPRAQSATIRSCAAEAALGGSATTEAKGGAADAEPTGDPRLAKVRRTRGGAR